MKTPYTFQDWQNGVRPPKGWDCADAIDDGWGKPELDAFMRATVRPWSPPGDKQQEPTPPAADPPQAPAQQPEPVRLKTAAAAPVKQAIKRHAGIDGVKNLPEVVTEVGYCSETWLANDLLARLRAVCGGPIVYSHGGFWAFGPTEWRELPEDLLHRIVQRYDAATFGKTQLKLKASSIKGVLAIAAMQASRPDFFDNPTIGVNVLNGAITIDDTGRVDIKAHDPDHRFRFTINAAFHLHTQMEPPEGSLLHKLLHGAFLGDEDADDKIKLIGEILGAAAFGLATRVKQPKAFVFLGETASNGKSTIASLLSSLLPAGAVSSISPAFLGDERRIVNLAGKAANVADELSASAIAGEAFKAVITGNPIEGRSLYKNAVTFTPRALHCFTTNTLPRFNGGLDRGLQRRLVVLRFNRTIPESEIITDIAERIQREELDLLLGFAIAGAQRLKSRGSYTIPESSKDALRGWLLLDPINEWFDLRVISAESEPSGGWMRTSRLFEDFKKWAVDNGYTDRFLPPVNTFSQRLKALPNVELTRRASGTVAKGVVLNQNGEVDPEDFGRGEW